MPKIDHEVVQIFKEDGDRIEDSKGRKVGSHIFSDKLGGIALPSRAPTDTYIHRELNRSPIKRSSVILETADPQRPEQDSDFVLSQAQAMWDAARLGLELEDESTSTERALKWLAGIATTMLALAACMYLVYVNEGNRELEELRRPGNPVIEIAPLIQEIAPPPTDLTPLSPSVEQPDDAPPDAQQAPGEGQEPQEPTEATVDPPAVESGIHPLLPPPPSNPRDSP